MRQMPPRRNCGAAFFLWRTPGAQRSARPPSRRQQCRSAASRTAGTLDRSRQPTGDSRPRPPGKSPGRGHPFLVSAAGGGGKNRIIFRCGVYVTKNPSHAATCENALVPLGLGRFRTKAECSFICQRQQLCLWRGSSRPKCQFRAKRVVNPEARSCPGRRGHGSAGGTPFASPAPRCWTPPGSSRGPGPW